MLEGLKEGLENLECVLSQCMPEGDWGLFEENNELRLLWQRFCDEIYRGHSRRAVIIAKRIFQIIDPQQLASNYWKAVKSDDFSPFGKNREIWQEFRRSIRSTDGTRIVKALNSFIEKALASLSPDELQADHG